MILKQTMDTDKTVPSICIPRVFSDVTRDEIQSTFERFLGKGYIERIDLVNRKGQGSSQDSFSRVFVHLVEWPSTESAEFIRNRLINGEAVNVVYREPWFWRCSASRVPKPQRNVY